MEVPVQFPLCCNGHISHIFLLCLEEASAGKALNEEHVSNSPFAHAISLARRFLVELVGLLLLSISLTTAYTPCSGKWLQESVVQNACIYCSYATVVLQLLN